jgi:hypothetical protein
MRHYYLELFIFSEEEKIIKSIKIKLDLELNAHA